MRIEQVTAQAFGPLHGQTLQLAEGLTVVAGDNESGKSSWHAALYAALCGRRRRPGKPPAWEARFTDLHRPWDGDEWLVTARIILDDGRRVELRQDLDGKVDCSATDLDTGRDLSSEIIVDGAPDATRWLGLDRASFLATACVEQAQLLRVREDAQALAGALQRATDTAGADATAAEALRLIEKFHQEHVGSRRAGSTRPLRRALDALEAAQAEVARARAAHEEYVEAHRRADELRDAADQAEAIVAAAEVVLARRRADERAARARQAHQRADQLARLPAAPGAVEPPSLDDDVVQVLAAWEHQPSPVELAGPTAAQLAAERDALPAAPDGDLAPAQEVLDADTELSAATAALTGPSGPPTRTRRAARRVVVVSALLITVGVVLLFGLGSAGRQAAGTGTLLSFAGIAGLAVGLGLSHHARRQRRQAAHAVRQAASAVMAALAARGEQGDQGEQGQQGRPGAQGEQGGGQADRGEGQAVKERDRFVRGEAALGLGGGAAGGRSAEAAAHYAHAAVRRYQQRCQARAQVATLAAQRAHLEARLADRVAAEQAAAHARAQRDRAAEAVLGLAQQLGLISSQLSSTPEQAAQRLAAWRDTRVQARAKAQQAQSLQGQLDGLLAGASLEELSGEAAAAADEAAKLTERLLARWPDAGELLARLDADEINTADLIAWRERARQARQQAARAAGELDERARVVPAVADAEEDLARAQEQLAAVQRLDETLQVSAQYLTRAQERVHHDVAPVLASVLRQWLPLITAGRYDDVAVDPATLTVRVCGPSRRWRDAVSLSHGTAEQIYLLLRLALVEHLTGGHDTAPLLFDEITVSSDPTRTAALLDLLAHIARDRQVVLFSQEEQVADWAAHHLAGRDRLVRLPVLPSS
jgi:hypothetical protein